MSTNLYSQFPSSGRELSNNASAASVTVLAKPRKSPETFILVLDGS